MFFFLTFVISEKLFFVCKKILTYKKLWLAKFEIDSSQFHLGYETYLFLLANTRLKKLYLCIVKQFHGCHEKVIIQLCLAI